MCPSDVVGTLSFLFLCHLAQVVIVSRSILCIMRSTMAIRTNSHNPPWMIRTAIRQAPDVMYLQIRLSTRCRKWRRNITPFTVSTRTSQRIQLNRLTSLVIKCSSLNRGRRSGSISECLPSQDCLVTFCSCCIDSGGYSMPVVSGIRKDTQRS